MRLVRFGFRLLYNEFAFTYDLVSQIVSLGAWRCWQQRALKHLHTQPGSLILELAHGTGNLQLDLYERGYIPVGFDISPFMGRIARRKLYQHGLPIRLIRGRAQQLPFASASFQAVVCTFPTNFIFMTETLSEANRVLQPEGQLLIVPNGILTGRGAADAAVEWLYRATGQRGGERFDMARLFDTYGFNVQVVQEPCPRSLATVIVAHKRP